MIRVLDKGYVRLVDVMGSDVTVVNAARVSYNKETKELREKDVKLIHYLARHGHTSPFRHATLQFEIYAPLMVTRQWWKYVVGSDHIMDAWNESSRRYVTEEPEFYIPKTWRSAPKDGKKQGSGEPVDDELNDELRQELTHITYRGYLIYNWALRVGVAPEMARLFLPAYALYVRWYWTASLQSVAHFLKQRLAEDAQWEIRQYAEAVYELAREKFPVSLEALLGEGGLRVTILAIDIETYSDRDLKKVGVYKYVESPRFNILLFGYAIDDEEVQVIQLARGEEIPRDVLEMLYDPHVIKTAWNAQFERVALSRRLGQQIPAVEWEDTMILAAYHGLPLSLDKAGQALGLEVQKMTATGTKLMNKFSKKGLRPEDDPAGWEKFVEYNRRDVEVERAIRKRLEKYKLPEKEKELWVLDQDINDRGVAVDLQMVREAIRISRAENEKLIGEIQKITGVDNPRSVAQLKKWLEQETEEEIETLDRRQLPKIIESIRDEKIKNALALRLEAAKSSIKKYEAIDRAVCADGRVRGLLQYYGASRTGRWAGRLVQVQNLPRNDMSDLEAAREMLRQGHGDMLGVVWDSTNDVLSQLIRTAFIASEGRRLLIADFSSIEARVLAWLAGEEWKLEVFRTHGKIYEATAAKMFGVPIESIKKGDPLRQRGKVAELALGYQGGVGALIRMGALEMGIEESELPALVRQWRTANPRIVEFWRAIEQAAKNVLDAGGGKEIVAGKIEVSRDRHLPALIIRLPSGRKLYYYRAGLNGDRIEFWNKNNKLEQTYGGKLTENVVQAISRDVLAEAIMRLEKRGYRIVFHVHDEIVAEMPDGEGSVEEMTQIMAEPVPWAPDLPLGAEGVESTFYRKE